MKIFISWSGRRSHAAALLLRDWLQDVLQYSQPFVSSEDIAKGRRWLPEIAGELEDSKFGIICLTRANMTAPWVLFEAGALGAKYTEGRVSCLLVGLQPTDVAPPLGQFQNTTNARDDVWKLTISINACAEARALPADRLERAFESHWPRLEKDLKEIEARKDYGDTSAEAGPRRDPESIAVETLETVRNVHRLLTESQAQAARYAVSAALVQNLLGESDGAPGTTGSPGTAGTPSRRSQWWTDLALASRIARDGAGRAPTPGSGGGMLDPATLKAAGKVEDPKK